MSTNDVLRHSELDDLFQLILKMETLEDCAVFFEDLCTMKELHAMAQRLKVAKMLLEGTTYEQIKQQVDISTATISRVNRCIQYGTGGYQTMVARTNEQETKEKLKVSNIF
ncbi:MAG: YerC/YecD family TrpR-related protein [Pygmaiobacter sp.]